MLKLLTIAWKDLLIVFRDRSALIMILAAPFVLSVGFGLVTGGLGGDEDNSAPISDIPVLFLNLDDGELGTRLQETFESEELADLILLTVTDDEADARRLVDADEAAAVVVVPAGFSNAILPSFSGATAEADPIEIYGSTARPISVSVVQTVVEQFTRQTDNSNIATQLTVAEMMTQGLLQPAGFTTTVPELAERFSDTDASEALITFRNDTPLADEEASSFNITSFFAPGMAILFLMYTVSLGGRTFLSEREEGTLSRMLTTPTTASQIVGGKMIGIFLVGFVQLAILIAAFQLLLGLNWGPNMPVLLLVIAISFTATGWGSVMAAFARTPGQVQTVGTALMLLFGIMGGTFGGPDTIPDWLRPLSQLTPNYWGLRAFLDLAQGGTLADISTALIWLTAVGVALFLLASMVFRNQYR